MTTLYTISDDRTKFCRKAMKANDGVWNLVTSAWREAGLDSRSCWSRAADELLPPKPPPVAEPANEIVRCSHRMLSLSLQCLKVV